MSGLTKVGASIGKAFGSFVQSKPAKYLATGAGLGGGAYITATGVSRGVDEINEATGLGNLFTGGDETTSKGAGTLGNLILLIGIAALVLFVFVPQFKKIARR